jgi:hypothetical protein
VPARTPDPVKAEAGRIGGHTSWANTTDRKARTQPATDAAWQKLLDEHDGDPQRAESALKAHLARLAMQANQAKRKAKAARHETPE